MSDLGLKLHLLKSSVDVVVLFKFEDVDFVHLEISLAFYTGVLFGWGTLKIFHSTINQIMSLRAPDSIHIKLHKCSIKKQSKMTSGAPDWIHIKFGSFSIKYSSTNEL